VSTLPLRDYLVPDTCVAEPLRSPFSRSGEADAGLYFFYVTNRRQWSVMLDATDPGATIGAADRLVPAGYAQLWVFEKVYSTLRARQKLASPGGAGSHVFSTEAYQAIPRLEWPGRLYVVFREPYPFHSARQDVLSYRSDREAAVDDARACTLETNRRAVVGLMRADIFKH
jgi:hypothetical protein